MYVVLYLLSVIRESLLDPDRGYKGVRFEGIDFFVEHMAWRKLPKEVFESTGGRDAAKARRQALLGIASTSTRKRKNSFGGSPDLLSPTIAIVAATTDADGVVKVETTTTAVKTDGRPATAASALEAKDTDRKAVVGEEEAPADNAVAMNLDSKFAVAVSDGSSQPSSKRIKFSSLVTELKKERKVLPSLMKFVPPVGQTRQPYRIPTKVTWLLLNK